MPSWRMAECSSCRSVSPWPYPSAEEIEGFYRSSTEANDYEQVYYVNVDELPGGLDAPRKLVGQLTQLHGSPGRLLEVGCAAGWMLKSAREQGWDAHGIEAAPKFSQFARERFGLDIFEGTVLDVSPGSLGVFDVIVALDVFEHFHDPLANLARLRTFVRPGGRLLMTTPNISSPVARAWGLRWRQILPSHITYSTPNGMKAVLERSGWHLERLSEPRYWDPDPVRERRAHLLEVAKFLTRVGLYVSVGRPSRRFPAVKRLPGVLTGGRMTWSQFMYRVGDQPVLGDVMMVLARAV